MKVQKWSASELKIVINNNSKDAQKLLPYRTISSINCKRTQLVKAGTSVKGIIYDGKSSKSINKKVRSSFFWTKAQDKIIKTHPFNEALQMLLDSGKTESAIRARASKLGYSTKIEKEDKVITTVSRSSKPNSKDLPLKFNGIEVTLRADIVKSVIVSKKGIKILSK